MSKYVKQTRKDGTVLWVKKSKAVNVTVTAQATETDSQLGGNDSATEKPKEEAPKGSDGATEKPKEEPKKNDRPKK